jgi:hypothetical protein
MGSGTICFWLLAAIVIAPAGILLGTHSSKVPTNVAYVSEEEGDQRDRLKQAEGEGSNQVISRHED